MLLTALRSVVVALGGRANRPQRHADLWAAVGKLLAITSPEVILPRWGRDILPGTRWGNGVALMRRCTFVLGSGSVGRGWSHGRLARADSTIWRSTTSAIEPRCPRVAVGPARRSSASTRVVTYR